MVGHQSQRLLGQDGLAPQQPGPKPIILLCVEHRGGQGLQSPPQQHRPPQDIHHQGMEVHVKGLPRQDLPAVPAPAR